MEDDIESVVEKIKNGIVSTRKPPVTTPICLVFGPKHAGKSTLIRHLRNDSLQLVEVPDLLIVTDYALKFIITHQIHTMLASAKRVEVLLVMDYASLSNNDEASLEFLTQISQLFDSQVHDLGLVVTTVDPRIDKACINKTLMQANKRYHLKLLGLLLDETSSRICLFRMDCPEKGINRVRELVDDLNPLFSRRIPLNSLLVGANKPYELKEYFKDRISSMIQDILFRFFNQLIEKATSVDLLYDRLLRESAKIELLADDPTIPDVLVDAYLKHLVADLVVDLDERQQFTEDFSFYNEMLDFLDGRDFHSKLISFVSNWVNEHKFLQRWLRLAKFLQTLNEALTTNQLLRIRDFWVDKEADLDQKNYGIVVTKDTFELFLAQLQKMRGGSYAELMQTEIDDLFLRHLNELLAIIYSNLVICSFRDTLNKVREKKSIVVLIGCKGCGKTNLVKTLIQVKYPEKRRFRTNFPTLYTHNNINYLDVPGLYDTASGQFSVDTAERLAQLLRSAKRVKFVFVVESALTYLDKVLSLVIGFIPDFGKYSKAIGLVVNKVLFNKCPTDNPNQLAYDYDTRYEHLEKRLDELLRRKLAEYQEQRETAQTMRELNMNRKKAQLLGSILESRLLIPKGLSVAKFTFFLLSFDPDTIFEYDLVEQNRDRLCSMIDGLEYVEPAFDDFNVD